MEYKGCTHIEIFKKRAGWATDKQLQVISNRMPVIPLIKELKNKTLNYFYV